MNNQNFMDLHLHHIGIVVKNIKNALAFYSNILGGNILGYKYEYVESQKVKICLVEIGNNLFVEFIEPVGHDSPVYNYSLSGGGLHHLCYEVDSVSETIENLKPYMKLIVKPIIGFQNRLIAFLIPKTDHIGVSLIEITEKK